MIKYFCLLFYIIFESSNIQSLKKGCNHGQINYKVGETYRKNDDLCRVCTCMENEIEICRHIESCHQLDCNKNSLNEQVCCELLQCARIYIINRQISHKKTRESKLRSILYNGWYNMCFIDIYWYNNLLSKIYSSLNDGER